MQHIAIMNNKWRMVEKLLNSEKTVESRWYKTKRLPWDRVRSGEVIYFKETSKPISVKAKVLDVLQFENLTRVKMRKLLRIYYRRLGIEEKDVGRFEKLFKDKKYCILILLRNVRKINKSFTVSKSGFGSQAAWILTVNIEKIKLNNVVQY